jgi:hypothetical protein
MKSSLEVGSRVVLIKEDSINKLLYCYKNTKAELEYEESRYEIGHNVTRLYYLRGALVTYLSALEILGYTPPDGN